MQSNRLNLFLKLTLLKSNTNVIYFFTAYLRGTPALHLNEPAGGSCFDVCLGLVWHCYCIYMTYVCLIQKKLRGQGCVESKNMTSAKRKSTMSSLNPPIIQVGSFKCRAGVPLRFDNCTFVLMFTTLSRTSWRGGPGTASPTLGRRRAAGRDTWERGHLLTRGPESR